MGIETEFKKEISLVSRRVRLIRLYTDIIEEYLKQKETIDIIQGLDEISNSVNHVHDFLLKYNDFFEILDKKFGTNTMKCSESSKKIIAEMKKEADQISVLVSQKKFKIAESILAD